MIYDCFTFFNEHTVLRLRLEMLQHVVDRFVLVESPVTHQGANKPLHFAEHRDQYAPWLDRIIHVVVEDMPETDDAWDREKHQRRCIMRGLTEAGADDLILVSDVDEIPRPGVVAELVSSISSPVQLEMTMHYFMFNLIAPVPWRHAKAARFQDLTDPESLRMTKGLPVIPDAGWHFSYLSPADGVRTKLRSFAHTEYSNDRYTSSRHIERSMRWAVDPFGKYLYELADDDALPAEVTRERFPAYFHRGRSRLQGLAARAYRVVASAPLPRWFNDYLWPVAVVPVATLRVVQRLRRMANDGTR